MICSSRTSRASNRVSDVCVYKVVLLRFVVTKLETSSSQPFSTNFPPFQNWGWEFTTLIETLILIPFDFGTHGLGAH